MTSSYEKAIALFMNALADALVGVESLPHSPTAAALLDRLEDRVRVRLSVSDLSPSDRLAVLGFHAILVLAVRQADQS